LKSDRGTAPARLLTPLAWGAAAVGLLGLLVVRPLAGLVVLAGSGLRFDERAATSFFGIRGVGSFYYLAYGYNTEAFGELDLVFALVGFVVSERFCFTASRQPPSWAGWTTDGARIDGEAAWSMPPALAGARDGAGRGGPRPSVLCLIGGRRR
jgi:hypothetical protein